MTTPLLTLKEAASRCRVSAKTLLREAADGRLTIVRIRSRQLVEPAELDRYIAASRECPSAAKATAGKCESAQALASALSNAFRPAPPAPTRRRSKWLSDAASSPLRLVESTTP